MIDFSRYLSAKKTVDDRALNRNVWDRLTASLPVLQREGRLRLLEIGCGIGTMVERLLEWGLAAQVDYLGIDSQASSLEAARIRLPDWGRAHGFQVCRDNDLIELSKRDLNWRIRFQEAELTSFWEEQSHHESFNLLIAQAFLDLIDVPKALPNLANLLTRNGLFYFTINFDGVSIFEPGADQAGESQIIQRYHQSMDERLAGGQPFGDSRTGRHLFTHLKACGAQILAAGAADWVVYPGPLGYPADEAYFLHCIMAFFETSLKGRTDLDQEALQVWLAARRGQIDACELIYIAHQIDFLGTFS